MRTVIYLDVLLLVNFVVGAAFLLAAGLLCGACCSPLRLVGGAGAAAVLRASSPKGGAIGIPRKVNGFARGSPTRGAGGRKPD